MAGVALARRVGDRRIEAVCLTSYAKALFRRGMVDSAIAINGQAVALDRATRDGAGLAAALQWQGYALVAAREYGPARRTLLEALDASRVSGNWLPAGVALMSLASLSVRFGELGGARRYANWADSLLLAQGNERSRAGVQAVHGDIARAAGDTAAARRAYNAALVAGPALRRLRHGRPAARARRAFPAAPETGPPRRPTSTPPASWRSSRG